MSDPLADHLADVLAMPGMEAITAICTQVIAKESTQTGSAAAVLRFFASRGRTLHLLKWAISREVATAMNGVPFRGTTPATRLAVAFYRSECQDLLEYCLKPAVTALLALPPVDVPPEEGGTADSPVVQPSAVPAIALVAPGPLAPVLSPGAPLVGEPAASPAPTFESTPQCTPPAAPSPSPAVPASSASAGPETDPVIRFVRVLQRLIERILSSTDRVPLELRILLKHAQTEVVKRNPQLRTAIVGVFLFLRFLAPAVIYPENNGLLDAPPTEEGRRNLILASRVLQWLANGATTSLPLAPHLQAVSEYATEKLPRITAFFEHLAKLPDETASATTWSEAPMLGAPSSTEEMEELYTVIAPCLPQMVEYLTKDLHKPDVASALKSAVDAITESKRGKRNSPQAGVLAALSKKLETKMPKEIAVKQEEKKFYKAENASLREEVKHLKTEVGSLKDQLRTELQKSVELEAELRRAKQQGSPAPESPTRARVVQSRGSRTRLVVPTSEAEAGSERASEDSERQSPRSANIFKQGGSLPIPIATGYALSRSSDGHSETGAHGAQQDGSDSQSSASIEEVLSITGVAQRSSAGQEESSSSPSRKFSFLTRKKNKDKDKDKDKDKEKKEEKEREKKEEKERREEKEREKEREREKKEEKERDRERDSRKKEGSSLLSNSLHNSQQ